MPVPAGCGNYMIEAAERCDGPSLDGTHCWDLGYADGEIACSARCTFDTSGCIPYGDADFSDIGTAICGWISRCEKEFGRVYESQSRCVDWFNLYGACEWYADTATESQVETCVSWWGSAPCDPLFLVDEYSWDPMCVMVLGGEAPGGLGDPCWDGACEADLYCDEDVDPCGLCLPLAGIGELCGYGWQSFVPCERDLYCDSESSTCAAKLVNGASCQYDDHCLSEICTGGTCAEALPLGAACTRDTDCAGAFRGCINGSCGERHGAGESCSDQGDCVSDAYCMGSVCVAWPLTPDVFCYEDSGDPAAPDDAQIGDNCSMRSCVPEAYCDWSGSDPICVALHQAGEACWDNYQCERNHYCEGVCLPFAGLGDSCSNGERCTPYTYCDGAVCQAEKAGGEPCVFDHECVSYYCEGGTCYAWDDEC